MCYAVTCKACGKTTWDGCGQHVDDVMREVPAAQQCRCPRKTEQPRRTGSGFWRR
ncbi:Uncharacterised protein [Mycolicibacterium gilvum]|uniref:Uncharacterized protein n=2 Tax=Mycolicibacterium gilvum TaxID=1804 RepID=A0A378SVP3_9MYCO|nr:conserved hypothetical protein [Mycolicibacterium gilvum PYR-GCK]STZ45924.1 Uncharacterised protein [Mycolicibacterium gilvum]